MRTLLFLCVLAFSFYVHAGEMEDAYARGKSNAAQYNNGAAKIINTTSLNTIPHNPSEINLRNDIADTDEAKAYALSDPEIKAEYDEAYKTLEERPDIDERTLIAADEITANPDKYVHGGAYCSNGECNDLVDEPNQEMIPTTAVLEDVLGGGNDYSQTGTYIYTGKKEKCKKADWGFADCCTDEGWGVDFHLTSCPKETKKLGEKKAAGKCHYVGKYEEDIEVGGIVVGKDEYKGYCCYSSKMARVTQEGAKPQLGKTWGSGKRPRCEGLTPDEFSQVDFSQVNLTEVYGDMSKKVAPSDPEKMLENPSNYYNDMGVNP